MLSNHTLKYHYHPAEGWLNDPNGLSCFGGYYHIFYQNCPHFEYPGQEPWVWGHARTKNFLDFEELPTAIAGDCPYDIGGAWSGTAIEKDGKLFAFYASITEGGRQEISMAFSEDGIHFTKYAGNPIISEYPFDCGGNFRDPAIFCENGMNYLVIASADKEKNTGCLLLYRSEDLYHWTYVGVMHEYEDCMFCECPSFLKLGDGYLLANSVCPNNGQHYFEVMYGSFDGETFTPEITSHFQKGPDEYAGQIFSAPDERAILISWVSGWNYQPHEKCIGCMSIPLEITRCGDILKAYPVRELRHLVEGDSITDDYITETYRDGGAEVFIRISGYAEN